MIAFKEETVEGAIQDRIQQAFSLRNRVVTSTNAYRLIHAEGDGLPGLIIDVYGEVVVIQISSKGIENYKNFIVDILVELLHPKAIYEKSTSFLRKKGGLDPSQGLLWGQKTPEFQVEENGVKFHIDLMQSQKTGLFLDQREMRLFVSRISKGKRVLNCFAYSGGFSLFALKGGAISVDSVEISEKACRMLQRNLEINGYTSNILCEDAFEFLKNKELPYDLILLDPPAFVKKRGDLENAKRAYRQINYFALKKMPLHSVLLTSSCSYHLSEEAFGQLIFQAALMAGREVKILSRHLAAHDHPVSIYHPESTYLKSLILFVV